MLTEMRTKIRGLIEDLSTTTEEAFIFTNSNILVLGEDKGVDVLGVKINGSALQSGQSFSYNAETNEVTVEATLITDDIVTIKYTFTKYSDTEIDSYIRSALVWMSICSPNDSDYELEDDGTIYPTPDNTVEDLICIIASILIKPDYSQYKLPNQTIVYPRTMDKETRIQKIIAKFVRGLGVADLITFDSES